MMTRLLLESWLPWQPEVCDLEVVEQNIPRRARYLNCSLVEIRECLILMLLVMGLVKVIF